MLVHVSNTGTGKRNLGTRNKGGQLMVIAVAQHYQGTGCTVAVDDSFGTAKDRARIGVARVCFPEYGMIKAMTVKLRNQVRSYGGGYAATGRNLSLNAAGYAYGDGWGRDRIEALRRWNDKSHADRCPIVLLPQAFGPFEQADHGELFVDAVKHVALIYARDRVSYGYLRELMPNDVRIRLAPDFTIPVNGQAPQQWIDSDTGDRLLIVPNRRMVDKLGAAAAAQYVTMLEGVAKSAPRIGLRPVFVIHSSEDDEIASQIMALDGVLATSVTSACPVELKGILAHGKVALASRFHSVVSALSGSTPTLVAGWSHKYAELLDDFGVPEFLLGNSVTSEDVIARLRSEADSSRQAEVQTRLQRYHAELLNQTDQMWSAIDANIELKQNAA